GASCQAGDTPFAGRRPPGVSLRRWSQDAPTTDRPGDAPTPAAGLDAQHSAPEAPDRPAGRPPHRPAPREVPATLLRPTRGRPQRRAGSPASTSLGLAPAPTLDGRRETHPRTRHEIGTERPLNV